MDKKVCLCLLYLKIGIHKQKYLNILTEPLVSVKDFLLSGTQSCCKEIFADAKNQSLCRFKQGIYVLLG